MHLCVCDGHDIYIYYTYTQLYTHIENIYIYMIIYDMFYQFSSFSISISPALCQNAMAGATRGQEPGYLFLTFPESCRDCTM